MKKNVQKINDLNSLPEPFRSYWLDLIPNEKHLERNYKFYLVDGELYVSEDDSELLLHWTHLSCCGVANYMHDLNIKKNDKVPSLVRKNGEYLFYLVYGEYEVSAVSPEDGKSFVVYDG